MANHTVPQFPTKERDTKEAHKIQGDPWQERNKYCTLVSCRKEIWQNWSMMLTLTTTLIFSYGSEHGQWRKVTKTGAQASDIQDLRSQDSRKEISIKRQAKFIPSTVSSNPITTNITKLIQTRSESFTLREPWIRTMTDRAHDKRHKRRQQQKQQSYKSCIAKRTARGGGWGRRGREKGKKTQERKPRVCVRTCGSIFLPMVGMVVTISPSFNLYRIVVLPAASRPTMRMRISCLEKSLWNSLVKVSPIAAAGGKKKLPDSFSLSPLPPAEHKTTKDT